MIKLIIGFVFGAMFGFTLAAILAVGSLEEERRRMYLENESKNNVDNTKQH